MEKNEIKKGLKFKVKNSHDTAYIKVFRINEKFEDVEFLVQYKSKMQMEKLPFEIELKYETVSIKRFLALYENSTPLEEDDPFYDD